MLISGFASEPPPIGTDTRITSSTTTSRSTPIARPAENPLSLRTAHRPAHRVPRDAHLRQGLKAEARSATKQPRLRYAYCLLGSGDGKMQVMLRRSVLVLVIFLIGATGRSDVASRV